MMNHYPAFRNKTVSLNTTDFLNVDDVNRNFVKIDENVARATTTTSTVTTTLRSVFEGIIPPPNKCVSPYASFASRSCDGVGRYVTQHFSSQTSHRDEKFRCQFEACAETFSEEYQLW